MKPFEILSAIPQWANATPDQILDSPAFAMPCRLGDEAAVLRLGAVEPGDTLDLAVRFGDEPHTLRLAKSPCFPELAKIWDSRAEIPEPILLALAEKECGALFQLLENAVRRQLRLVGLADPADTPDARTLPAQVSDIVFTLTRSPAVVDALGVLRNLDLSDPSLRAGELGAEVEYAAFALPAPDLALLAVGDALLLPEIGSIPPRLLADGRFTVDENGVSPFADDGRCRIIGAEPRAVTLGELFDAAENQSEKAERPESGDGLQLRLVQNGKTLANGHLGRVGEQPAFIVEAVEPLNH